MVNIFHKKVNFIKKEIDNHFKIPIFIYFPFDILVIYFLKKVPKKNRRNHKKVNFIKIPILYKKI